MAMKAWSPNHWTAKEFPKPLLTTTTEKMKDLVAGLLGRYSHFLRGTLCHFESSPVKEGTRVSRSDPSERRLAFRPWISCCLWPLSSPFWSHCHHASWDYCDLLGELNHCNVLLTSCLLLVFAHSVVRSTFLKY